MLCVSVNVCKVCLCDVFLCSVCACVIVFVLMCAVCVCVCNMCRIRAMFHWQFLCALKRFSSASSPLPHCLTHAKREKLEHTSDEIANSSGFQSKNIFFSFILSFFVLHLQFTIYMCMNSSSVHSLILSPHHFFFHFFNFALFAICIFWIN